MCEWVGSWQDLVAMVCNSLHTFIIIIIIIIIMHNNVFVCTHKQSYYQFQEQYSQLTTTSAYSFLAPLTYDAVWTLALAVHQVHISLMADFNIDIIRDECGEIINSNMNLGDFNYSNSYIGCRIKEELLQTYFVGVSVR